MASRRVSKIVAGTSRRLKQLRNHFNYSVDQMARKLGLSKSGYFKNEGGFTFPGLQTLDLLQGEYDISIDWLLFNKGPMNFTKKTLVGASEGARGLSGLENVSAEVLGLVGSMEQDPLLRAEMLVHYYKYQEKKAGRIAGKKGAPREKS